MIANNTDKNRRFEIEAEGFELFFNSSSDITLILDRNKNVFVCNTAFLQIFHVAKDDIVGKPFSALHYTKFIKDNLKHDFSLFYENLMRNSDIVFEKNGCLKFSGIFTPNISPIPNAISIVPEKSMYNCNV